MVVAETPSVQERYLDSGDEAGTAPGDRRFRPDVEGLRAVAIGLVVLFHANVPGIKGGFVGVDVFFVISGYVITGLLLRERASSGRTSILAFYGRRCRRIIPAATLVILATIAASYLILGILSGDSAATDGKWAAVFLVNFHFASEATNYLSAQQPPSPLQNFWSLSVEEQFYVVYPTLFLALATVRTRISFRMRLAVGLIIVIIGSFALSVSQTSSNPTVAYFSPFTRAWELALGALIAVGTNQLFRLRPHVAAAMGWLGLGAILISAVALNTKTPYPGSLVAVPVVGAGLVIAGGVVAPTFGAERLLALTPFQWLGKLSYSLYLWHWPILIIAAEKEERTNLPVAQALLLLALALGASVVSYVLVENPIRHATVLSRRRWASIVLGGGLIALTVTFATVSLHTNSSTSQSLGGGAVSGTDAQVSNLVKASTHIQRIPAGLTPSLSNILTDWGGPPGKCAPAVGVASAPPCVFGDPQGRHTMVLYGDSHALMWFQAMNAIAKNAHWRLVIVAKGYCSVDRFLAETPSAYYGICGPWQNWALRRIKEVNPDLVVATQEESLPFGGGQYTNKEWQQGLEDGLKPLEGPHTTFIVLGNIPQFGWWPAQCLGLHQHAVQQCSESLRTAVPSGQNDAEERAVTALGGRYINVAPWFCSDRCSVVIGRYQPYFNQQHITETYSAFLERVLAEQLQLSKL